MALAIRELDKKHEAAWDAFVSAMTAGTFFHRAAWRHVIEQSFGHRTCYVFAEQDGAITGVLPLVHMRSLVFGSRLISVPFCVYGGPLATDPETARALSEHSIDLMQRVGANLVEFRMREPGVEDWKPLGSLCHIPQTVRGRSRENLKAIPRKQRAVIPKGLEYELRSQVDQDPEAFHASTR
jgi:hypothetical protein